MSDGFWIALFAAVPPTIVALAGLVVSMRNGRQIGEQKTKVDEVVKTVRMRDTEIDLLKTGAFRKGHIAGMEYQKAQSDFGKLSGK